MKDGEQEATKTNLKFQNSYFLIPIKIDFFLVI